MSAHVGPYPLPFDIRHHAIPPRLAPYIERALTIDFVAASGLRWHALPSGCFGLGVFLGSLEQHTGLVDLSPGHRLATYDVGRVRRRE